MDGKSLLPQEEKLRQLAQIFPEALTEGKIDWEKLKAALGEAVNFANERYVLNWAGKSDAFKALQSPSFKTLVPVQDQSLNFDQTEHLFIEGENLEVLKVLQKSYFNKVKMIYIDPPYNTGNDSFIYPDKFAESKEAYRQRVGDKDEEGYMTGEGMFRKNSQENGHYHSNWLSMMYPRLFLAKNLLRPDGVIFISIDDNEVHNLRLLMNEVFGEENFVGNLIWKSRQVVDSRNQQGLSSDHEYILVYAKDQDFRLRGKQISLDKYSNPDNDSRGPWMSNSILGLATKSQRPNLHYEFTNPETGISYTPPPETGWRYSKETLFQKMKEKRLIFPKNGDGRPREKKFLYELNNEFTGFSSILSAELGYTLNGTRELREILGDNYFPFPKPIALLKELVQQGIGNDDPIILDFFAGSGTLAHAVMELNKEDGGNRRYICVQLPEKTDEKSEAYKAGYPTIAGIARERIRRAAFKIAAEIKALISQKEAEIQKLEGQFGFEGQTEQLVALKLEIEKLKSQDLGFKAFKLSDSNFKQWQQLSITTKEELETQLALFVDPITENATVEAMAYELLLKAGKDINTLNHKSGYYTVNQNELVLLLEEVGQEIITAVIAQNPQKVIALDKLFQGNDQLKTNTALQMKDAHIEFNTI